MRMNCLFEWPQIFKVKQLINSCNVKLNLFCLRYTSSIHTYPASHPLKQCSFHFCISVCNVHFFCAEMRICLSADTPFVIWLVYFMMFVLLKIQWSQLQITAGFSVFVLLLNTLTYNIQGISYKCFFWLELLMICVVNKVSSICSCYWNLLYFSLHFETR